MPPCEKQLRNKKICIKKTWIIKVIFKSINTKNKLFKRYITFSNKTECSRHKKYRNKLNLIICAAKSNYYNYAAIKHKFNSREMWIVINETIQIRRLQNREKI